jgi:DNA invertase Pin-like site-specific DNA recombinase
MAKIGCARVSTLDQHPGTQIEALTAAGCEELFTDHGVSGTRASRPELDRCLAYVREGDQLVVWKLDRLGRSVSHLVHVVEELRRRGVQFTTLTEQLGTATPAGRLMFHILAALAEMERELIRERTLAGIERARAEGRMWGRQTVMGPERSGWRQRCWPRVGRWPRSPRCSGSAGRRYTGRCRSAAGKRVEHGD